MGKRIRLFFLFLLTTMVLFGAPNPMQQLEQYTVQLKQANRDDALRIFHGLKALYIQSVMNGDDALKKETLSLLIEASKRLNYDSSKYASELATLEKQNASSSRSQTYTDTNKRDGVSEKSAFPTPSNKGKALSSSPNNASTQNLPKSYKGKNVLQSIESNDEEIVLHFGSPISEQSIKIFVLKSSDSYKKVIDIPAVILNAPLNIQTPQKLKHIRISQYNNDLLRIVLDAPKSFETYVSTLESKVVISLEKEPNISKNKPQIESTSQKSHVLPPEKESMPVVSKTVQSSSSLNRNKTIVIDAGHGGKDPGAIGYKKKMEKHLMLEIALALGKELKSRGYKVFYTRQKDVFINLRDRTKVANDKNADLFISLHANAAPTEAKQLSMKGLETFFLSPDRSERSKNVAALENKSDIEEMNYYSKETFLNVFNREKIILSNKAAIDIQSHMLNSVKKRYAVEDGGVREAPFWVLVGATMPSVLIEVGYITNPEESTNMHNPQYQKMLVDGISNGLDQYFSNNP
ncbi:N-acetylmuramoyl-L-alanine amidase [Sulfurospirillum barnesii]|uniref:N-acetylmuramoyl-L-alanine amidase n=1 Tax=Sulfurospirillum barnesii (strain ATCC 700032 / DSM 10660 / SES-3) TaxID=760154 RepID=I3XVN6_SULBS|nr:N-acetylmuramoyl-L-alanine amidase [Sulfurospirillum barnesii]AFL68010.1 N-acetylmuramoyl-L-alanine amidase [Sulfurospirillum barnesii SES-3]